MSRKTIIFSLQEGNFYFKYIKQELKKIQTE